jgi:hypothetical protein
MYANSEDSAIEQLLKTTRVRDLRDAAYQYGGNDDQRCVGP